MKRWLVMSLFIPLCGGVFSTPAFAQNPQNDPMPSQAIPGSNTRRRNAHTGLTQAQRDRLMSLMQQQQSTSYPTAITESNNREVFPGFGAMCQSGKLFRNAATFGTLTFDLSDEPEPTAGTTGEVAAPGVDSDLDGLTDEFEKKVSNYFRPFYRVSTGEKTTPAPATGFAKFAPNVPYLSVTQNLPSFPVETNHRVHAIGFARASDGTVKSVLQIDYLTIWNKDDGLQVSSTCQGLTALLGLSLEYIFPGHANDPERSAVLVAAPATRVGGSWVHPTSATAYSAYSYYFAAHEGEPNDKGGYLTFDSPIPAGNHIVYYLSKSKHATYPFQPNNYPLAPTWVIYATYAGIDALYITNRITYLEYLALLYAADVSFFVCNVEKFTYSSSREGYSATPRTNVGELGREMNGAKWINDTNAANHSNIRGKLDPTLWYITNPAF